MNIVQLHERVRFWIDTVASTRFESEDIDQAINNSIHEIVDEKYDHSRLNHRGDAFQRTQRVRDELMDLVKVEKWSSDPAVGNTNITYYVNGTTRIQSFPTGYKYMVAISIIYNNVRYNCFPLTYDRKNVIEQNPFRRVRSGLYPKLYYIESQSQIQIQHPFGSASGFTVELDYISDAVNAFYGYEKGPSDAIGDPVNCIVSLSPTEYDSVIYNAGDEFTTTGAASNITYGLVVVNWINPNIERS